MAPWAMALSAHPPHISYHIMAVFSRGFNFPGSIMKTASLYLVLEALCGAVTASPTSVDKMPTWDESISGALDAIQDALKTGDRNEVLGVLKGLEPKSTPTSLEEASSTLEDIAKSSSSNIFDMFGQMVGNGLISGTVLDLINYGYGIVTGESGWDNE